MCGTNLILNNINIIVFLISLIVLFVSFRKVRDTATVHRTAWIYLNAVSFIFPILFVIFSASCAPAHLLCNMNSMLYAIPVAIALSSLFVFVLVSQLVKVIFGAKRITDKKIDEIVNRCSKQINTPKPEIYIISEQKPLSFSSFGIFRQKIFFSVGLFELLTKKEFESVLLHEMYHIKRASSFSKFSAYFLRIFSPMLHFSSNDKNLNHEEEMADLFAIEVQKTARYVSKAKKKVLNYENFDKRAKTGG